MEGIIPFCFATDTLLWTSGNICPGFQNQGGSLACVLYRLRAMDSSDSPLMRHLLTSCLQRSFFCTRVSGTQLNLHQCLWTSLQVHASKRLGCNADFYTVSRCESEDHTDEKAHKKGSTLAFKSRADVTRSPKQGYQWPHEKNSKILKELITRFDKDSLFTFLMPL